jgi:predicted transcriptional regulator
MNDVRDASDVIGDTGCHRRRYALRLMHRSKIVEHEVSGAAATDRGPAASSNRCIVSASPPHSGDPL